VLDNNSLYTLGGRYPLKLLSEIASLSHRKK
jgi:hypothetical protein